MKLFFIDLDGTLENSKLDMSLCVNVVRKKLQIPEFEIGYIEQYVNKGMDELYRNCFFDFLEQNPQNYDLVKNEYEETYFNNVCVHTKCYEGIPEALSILSQHGKIVVVTNKPEKISRELLKQLHLTGFISNVMGGDTCAECKPSALPLKIAAQQLNFNSNFDVAYMIGDSEGDVKAANAFGAKSVWCSWGYFSKINLTPDIIVHSPQELQKLI